MASDESGTANLPVFYGLDKSDWEAVGCRIPEEHLRLIDEAAKVLNLKRAHFIHQAIVEAAVRVVPDFFRRAMAERAAS